MLDWLQSLAHLIFGFFLPRTVLMDENIALRQQLTVLRRRAEKAPSFYPHRSIVVDCSLSIIPRSFERYPYLTPRDYHLP
jgi:hypothetical protein